MEKKKRRSGPLTARQLLFRCAAAVLLLALAFTLPSIIRKVFDKGTGENGEVTADLDPAGEKGEVFVTEVDIKNAILGAAREQTALVIYEQDIKQEYTITKSVMNWDIFTKTKTVRMFGTGYYAVDLSGITAERVHVNMAGSVVEIVIPRAYLLTVSPDYSKTEFEDMDRGWLAFGDIKLNAEQQNEIQKDVYEHMEAALKGEVFMRRADTAALSKCKELFQKVLEPIPGVYVVSVKFGDKI